MPELLSSVRSGDALGSPCGDSAQVEDVSDKDVPTENSQVGQVNVRACSTHRARWPIAGLLLVAAWSAGCVRIAESPSRAVRIGDLVSNPAAFDGKLVTVVGRVSDVEFRNGSRGKPVRHVFNVTEDSHVVRVVATAGPTCREGSTATVNGRFSQRDGVVDATWVVC
jgi:hypothetical protein